MSAGPLVKDVLVVAEYCRFVVYDGGRKTVDREPLAEIVLETYAVIVALVDTYGDKPSGKPFIDLVQALGHIRTVGAPSPGEIEHKGATFVDFRFWFRFGFGLLLVFFPIRVNPLTGVKRKRQSQKSEAEY